MLMIPQRGDIKALLAAWYTSKCMLCVSWHYWYVYNQRCSHGRKSQGQGLDPQGQGQGHN